MRNLFLLISFLSSQIICGQLTVSEKEQVIINAETLLKQAIELEDFVGVAAGVSQNGDIIWEGGAGWSNRVDKIPAAFFEFAMHFMNLLQTKKKK